MTTQQNVNAGTRLVSMILDHLIMTVVAILFSIPVMIKAFAQAITISHAPANMDPFSGPVLYVALTGFALYFCKDCINGRSIGKRIVKHQVIDASTGKVASPFKCFIRNIFCALWPVEVIVTFIKPARRIGDLVAGTAIVDYNPAITEQPAINVKKLILPLVASYGLLLLFVLPTQSFRPSSPSTRYVASYNAMESKALEKLYNDSLGRYAAASVKVYDTVENRKIKYISIILQLKENYLEDDGNAAWLKQLTSELLYSVHPENTFTGQVQYVYRRNGSIQIKSHSIGTGG